MSGVLGIYAITVAESLLASGCTLRSEIIWAKPHRPPYEPPDKDRRVVKMKAGLSIPEDRIAQVLGVGAKTLRKHFAQELEVGHAKLEAQLTQNLLRIAQGHDRQSLIATIFALKSRFG